MKPVQVIPIKVGISSAYIIKQENAILIDTGVPGKEGVILNALHQAGIDQNDLKLILISHGHQDHAGSAARLQEVTKAPIAVHENDAPMLRAGTQGYLVPTGLTGRIAGVFFGSANRSKYPKVNPDIVIKSNMDLTPYGIDGTVIPTPGHTMGSVSVVLKNGDTFVGDLIVPQIPSGKPGLPFWADKPDDVYQSIKTLLAYNPKTFYLGHGGPFSVTEIQQIK